ncbi:MAG: hypothetical protein RLO52_20760 [Sandaracinaceae bacterium]|nr:MAG: hypothetical protein EVA89_13965 [Sandaracinaceae bacterium]
MPRATMLARWLVFGAAGAMAIFCASSPGHAQRRGRASAVRVAVGETAGSEGDAQQAAALAGAISAALDHAPDVRLTSARRAQLVVRGSVVRLERTRVAEGFEVRCEVSLIVADARGGSVRAMLRGRAGARGGQDVARLRANALQAAVRGALRPLGAHGRALARGH